MSSISTPNPWSHYIIAVSVGGVAVVFFCAIVWFLGGIILGRRVVWTRRQRNRLAIAIGQFRERAEKFEDKVNKVEGMATDYYISLQMVRRFMPNLVKLRGYRDRVLGVEAALVELFEEGNFDLVKDMMLFLGGDSAVHKEQLGGVFLDNSINLLGWESLTEPILTDCYADIEGAAQGLDQIRKGDDFTLKRRQTLDKLEELRQRL